MHTQITLMHSFHFALYIDRRVQINFRALQPAFSNVSSLPVLMCARLRGRASTVPQGHTAC